MRTPNIRSSLFANSLYLMLATGVVTGLGFVFWVIIARSYSAETVGVATTLLSLSGLISLLSLAGFDTTLVRFLPRSSRKNDYINSGLMVVAALSIVLSLGGIGLLRWTSPSLAAAVDDPVSVAAFVLFTLVTSLNTLTNSVFLAHKRTKPIFIINFWFSLLKVVLPLVVLHGTAMTIFVLAGTAQLVGLVFSLGWMAWRFGHRFSPRVHADILHRIKAYSSSAYIGTILNLLPPTLLPVIITRELGPAQAAYYYIAFAAANMLYTIAYAAMQAAFAEGSHNEHTMRQHMAKAVRLALALLLPATLVVVVFGAPLLSLFGHGYALAANHLLVLFALGGLPVAAYSGVGVVFKILKNLRGMVVMNVVYAVVILGGSWLFIRPFGLAAVGWAWLAGNIMACLVALAFTRRNTRARAPAARRESKQASF